MNTPRDSLTRSLGHEAEQFSARGGTELDLAQVLDRAGEIRRGRRMRASLLMAACVLAVAAPVGIVALDHDSARREPTPARPVVDHSPLTLSGLQPGAAPHTGYVVGRDLHRGTTTSRLPAGDRVVAFAAFKGGVMIAVRDSQGDLRARRLDSGPTWPMSGGFAVSAGRDVVAFAQPDGTPVVVQGDTATTLPKIAAGSGFDAVAVSGEECTDTSTACSVWVDSRGQEPAAWISTAGGSAEPAGAGMVSVADVISGRLVAGTTSVTDTGSCSAVVDAGGTTVWSTCEHRLLSFSPDGRRLLASAAYADGLGDTGLTVLDAGTGKVGLDLSVADGGAITQMVWEDDTHVLAVVYQGNRWGVVRIGLDGRRELAVAPVRDSGDLGSPFVLPPA